MDVSMWLFVKNKVVWLNHATGRENKRNNKRSNGFLTEYRSEDSVEDPLLRYYTIGTL